MIALLTLLFCSCSASNEWIDDYNNDSRPFCPTDLDRKSLNNRIVGGNDAGLGTFPYAVGILFESPSARGPRTDNSFCGGTLITDRHVLTAAHCLYNRRLLKDSLWVNVKDYDTKDQHETNNIMCRVEGITIHRGYKEKTFNNDIAIMTLRKSILSEEGVTMAILPPPDRKLEVGTVCTVWGWGRTSYDGSRSTVMQKVDIPITSREECQIPLAHTITENMICAGGMEGEDACLGDSGGSLLSRDGNVYCLAGIVSFGKNCALKGVSGVYTNLPKYTGWIYEATRSAVCKPRILLQNDYN